MIIFFNLYDKEDENIMILKGSDYIPPIGSTVYFSDSVDTDNREIIGIDCVSVVTEYFYSIEGNQMDIICKANEDLSESWYELLEKYNKIKYKK